MTRRLPDLRPHGSEGSVFLVVAVAHTVVALGAGITFGLAWPDGRADTGTDCWDEASCAATAAGYVVLDPAVHRAPSDGEPGYDCRVQGDRVCGSNVVWQAPGDYPAPDGGTYRVVEVDPHEACLAAAAVPGVSGFAPEVCEPLTEGYDHTRYVFTGAMSYTLNGGTAELPPLADSVADSCGDADDDVDSVRECVQALIDERTGPVR